MSSVSKLMKEYFKEDVRYTSNIKLFESTQLPILPQKLEWRIVQDPERFMRRFEFDNRARLKDFIAEILKFEDEIGHHSRLNVDHLTVDIEVYTKDVDCVTELDQEFIRSVDNIHRDILEYGYSDG